MRAPLALLLSLTVSISPPHALALEQDEVTPFETGDQGGIILRVMLNGRGPFRFLLDTGSTHTAVSEKTAALIGAPVVAKTTLGSVAGIRAALVVRIDALEIGPINFPDLLATVANLGMAGGVDGVIGHDALRTLRYTIDFPSGGSCGGPLTRQWLAERPSTCNRSRGGSCFLCHSVSQSCDSS
jgi:hypothetical protein